MELPSKVLEQIAFNTRAKIEEHMLVVMDKSIHEEHLSQTLQTHNILKSLSPLQLVIMVFLTSQTKIKNCFTVSINNDDINRISIPLGAYEMESLNKEIKRIFIEEGFFNEIIICFQSNPIFRR